MPAMIQLVALGLLGRLDELVDVRDAGVFVDPQQEGIFGHPSDRRERRDINLEPRIGEAGWCRSCSSVNMRVWFGSAAFFT